MLYPDRVPDSTHIPTFFFANEDDIIYVHYVFMLLNRLIYGRDKDTIALRTLLRVSLRLYGWEKTPLYQTIRNDESTLDEIKKSRSDRFDEEGKAQDVKGVRIFWSHHDALLHVPMSWYRPGIMEGDVICHHMFRYEDRKRQKPILPSLEDRPYGSVRKTLQELGRSSLAGCQEIERIFVELYGGVRVSSITVKEILKEAPLIEEEYFTSWQYF